MKYRCKFLNIVKLLAYLNEFEPVSCFMCGKTYTDAVEHFIMSCESWNHFRNEMWQKLLDPIDIACETDMFKRANDDVLEILLGKEWPIMADHDKEQFMICLAEELYKIVQA